MNAMAQASDGTAESGMAHLAIGVLGIGSL